jgi:hypothetical protein
MENEEGLYEGVGSGGRATQKILRQFREAMTADHRQLIDGGREMPDPTILDPKVLRLRSLLEPFADMIIADQLPTPEQTSLHGSLVKQLEVVVGTRAEAITLRAQMTAAADAGVTWWRTKGGTAIHNIIARYAGEENRMIQLRKVVQCVRDTYGGIPSQIQKLIMEERDGIPAVKDKTGLMAIVVRLEKLRQEERELADNNPEAIAAGTLQTAMTQPMAVDWIRSRIRNDASILAPLRDWLDKPRLPPLEWEAVRKRIVHICQFEVKVVGTATSELGAGTKPIGHPVMAAQQQIHQATLQDAVLAIQHHGGHVSFGANLAMGVGSQVTGPAGVASGLSGPTGPRGLATAAPLGGGVASAPIPRSCRDWSDYGQCRRGNLCYFAHNGPGKN